MYKDNTANTKTPHKAFTSEPRCRHSSAHPDASCTQTLLRQLTNQRTSQACNLLRHLCETSTYTEGSAMDTGNYHLPGQTQIIYHSEIKQQHLKKPGSYHTNSSSLLHQHKPPLRHQPRNHRQTTVSSLLDHKQKEL